MKSISDIVDEKIREDVRVVMIFGKPKTLLLTFSRSWEYTLLKQKGAKLFVTNMGIKDFEKNAYLNKLLTEFFWTCNCEKDYVQTLYDSHCKKCDTRYTQRTDRIKQAKEVFQWGNVAIFTVEKINREIEEEEIDDEEEQ